MPTRAVPVVSRSKARAVASATLLLASLLPSVAFADDAVPPPPPPAPLSPVPKHRNTAMMIAGMVLTGIGSAMLVGGAIATGVALDVNGQGGLVLIAAVGLPLMGGSVVFAGVGVPLWVVGAQAPPVPPGESLPRARVELGPSTLRVSF